MRASKGIVVVLVIILICVAGHLSYIGYFGGPIFKFVSATASPKSEQRGVAAVILSGDMGFNVGMGPKVAQRLAADGIPVVGVNSLTYFRKRRSVEEAEVLIADAIKQAFKIQGTQRVVLIGQSFGADMLQVGLSRLPQVMRDKILMVVLIVPGDTVDFRASPAELLDFGAPDAKALPTAQKLDWTPLLCVRGALETDSLCPELHMPNVEKVVLPGGHKLNKDVRRLHSVIERSMMHAMAH